MKRELHTRKIKFSQEEQKTIFIERSKMKRKSFYEQKVLL